MPRFNDAARWLRRRGRAATTGEVAHELGISLWAARAILDALRAEGKVVRLTYKGDDSWKVEERGEGRRV